MTKNIRNFVYAIIVLTVFIACTAKVQANDCLTGILISNGGNGSQASIEITNGASCGVKTASFCSYRVYIKNPNPGWLDTQTLYDTNTITLQGGETRIISVDTDVCQNQVDAFEGECIVDFIGDAPSLPTIFAGQLNDGEVCASCVDECSPSGKRECSGNGYRQCGNYDSDSCLEWGPVTDCVDNQTCTNGSCIFNNPTVDLASNGLAACNQNATLSWTSSNAANCNASGSWSGNKSLSGSENVEYFTGSRTYTLTCNNGTASASDSVTISSNDDSYDLEVNAGSDKYIDAGDSVRLDGAVDGDYDRVSWSCGDGRLSDEEVLKPTFYSPSSSNDSFGDNDDRTYTCTLTARNECASDSDSVKIHVAADEPEIGQIAIQKWVSNLSADTAYQGAITARPGDLVSYKITVTSNSGNSTDIVLRDQLPQGIVNPRDLAINGAYNGGNIESGIDLGDLDQDQSKTVTFTATVTGDLEYGQNELTNVATATANGDSASARATVYVYRFAVAMATVVSTGFTDKTPIGFAVVFVIIALALIWILKALKKPADPEALLTKKINSIKKDNPA